MESIHVITTGGTIDKQYGDGKGVRDMHIGPPIAIRLLRKMVPTGNLGIFETELLCKDSLDMTEEDRMKIGDCCLRSQLTKIIITHGTDTMKETAESLSDTLPAGKTIVLTGALQPAAMRYTDAEFNLGAALATCLYAPPGIYIAMNGVHRWNKCRKDPETGIFRPTM